MNTSEPTVNRLIGRASMSMISSKRVSENHDSEGSLQLLGNCLCLLGDTVKRSELCSLSPENQFEIFDLLDRAVKNAHSLMHEDFLALCQTNEA